MRLPTRSKTLLTLAATTSALAFAALLWPPDPADAQGVMTAPACQCSAPTAIPSLSTEVVHCLCGAMSCVLGKPTTTGAGPMQCVR